MQEQPVEEIKKQFTALENDPEVDPLVKVLIPKLQAILAGSRDPGLAADPELHFTDAADVYEAAAPADGTSRDAYGSKTDEFNGGADAYGAKPGEWKKK